MKNKKILYICLHIALVFFYFLFYTSNPESSTENLRLMGLFGWAQIIVSIVGWKHMTGKLFVPYIIFLIAAYTFCFGQSLLDVFGLVAPNRSLFNRCSASEIYKAQVYTLFFLAFFQIGALVSYKKSDRSIKSNETAYYAEYKAISNIGKTLSIISFLPFLVENITNFMIVSLYGYHGLYEVNPDIPLWGLVTMLSDFFIPALLCILLTSKPGSGINKRIFFMSAATILIIMYCGGRSQGVVLVAVGMLYYQNYVKPITKRGWALLAIGGFFFVSLLSAIAHLRGDSRENYIEEIANYKSEDDVNPFFETISEMGGSMHPMCRTIDLVPRTEPYRYGKTYVYAFSSLIPNLGFWKRHPAAENANMGEWLMKKDGLNYGPGYSIVAEAYINWGGYGFIMLFVLGFYFCKILNIDDSGKYKMLSFLIAIIFTYLSLKMVRNSFIGTVRILALYLFPIYWYVSYQVKKARTIKSHAHQQAELSK